VIDEPFTTTDSPEERTVLSLDMCYFQVDSTLSIHPTKLFVLDQYITKILLGSTSAQLFSA
jgi:hypothetical protein